MKLFDFERDWFEKVLESLMPPGGSERYPWSARDTEALDMFAEMVSLLPASTAVGLRAAVWFFELLGPMVGAKKFARFSGLSPDQREACLAALSKSDIYMVRQMTALTKMVAGFGYGADPRVRHALGMDDPPKFIQPVPKGN